MGRSRRAAERARPRAKAISAAKAKTAKQKAKTKADERRGDRHTGKRASGKYKRGSRKGTWKTTEAAPLPDVEKETLKAALDNANKELEELKEKYKELKNCYRWERTWRIYYEGCVRGQPPQ